MKKTKFRAFDPVQKKMYFGTNDRSEYNSKEKIYSLETFFRLIGGNHLNTLEFDQFTGLKDKDNVEIYENDILYANGLYYEIFKKTGGAYQTKNNNDKFSPRFLFNSNKKVEVANNKHQNPKLLKD